MNRVLPTILIALVGGASIGYEAIAKPPVDFARDVAPIFERHCIRCHQPANKKSKLSLATFADLAANEYVVPGDPDASYLLRSGHAARWAAAADAQGRRRRCPTDEVDVLRAWIAEGATWPDGCRGSRRGRRPTEPGGRCSRWRSSSRRRTAFPPSGAPIRSIALSMHACGEQSAAESAGRSPHAHSPRDLRSHRTCRRRRKKSTHFCATIRPTPTKDWSIGCSLRRATASTGAGTGSMWCDSAKAPASK